MERERSRRRSSEPLWGGPTFHRTSKDWPRCCGATTKVGGPSSRRRSVGGSSVTRIARRPGTHLRFVEGGLRSVQPYCTNTHTRASSTGRMMTNSRKQGARRREALHQCRTRRRGAVRRGRSDRGPEQARRLARIADPRAARGAPTTCRGTSPTTLSPSCSSGPTSTTRTSCRGSSPSRKWRRSILPPTDAWMSRISSAVWKRTGTDRSRSAPSPPRPTSTAC